MADDELNSEQNAMDVKSIRAADLLKMAVLATAVAGLLYFGYFQLAPWIWSQNLRVDSADIPPWYVVEMVERDGIELYALYALMFLNLLCAYVLTGAWNRFAKGHARYFLVLPIVVACAFIGSIGFHPPVSTLNGHSMADIFAWSLKVVIALIPITALFYYLQQRSPYWMLALAALVLIPACFISTAPIEWYDYSYSLAPALRLFHGTSISEIYFQYDLLLSLIALAWMKLQLVPNSIQIVGQCAYYLLFLGVFAFSRKWLLDKRLPAFLLIALVLVRIYAGPGDAVHSFQGTPIRYDMWLILLMLVYFKGPYHWNAGLFCGLMLLLHNNFGMIYSAAYIQLLLSLCLINTTIIPGHALKTASTALTTFLKSSYPNLIIILGCALAHYLLFRNPDVPNDFNYIRIGFYFIKIATTSFYWYVMVVSGLTFVLLIRLRLMLSSNYLAAGLCLIYLAIGNSLYFFGRSHENALIVLSPVFLLLFFLLLDIAGYVLKKDSGKHASSFIYRNFAIIISITFIASITIWYGDSITYKAATQAHNAGKGQFIYPSEVSEQYVLNTIAEVKSVTGDNPKVYFVGDNDFLFDYYGNFAPVGYYTPVYAWISMYEFNKFLQGLVDQGYYLVVDNGIVDVLSPITFSNSKNIGGRWVIWK
ncbi:MAG: hypothetical protein ABI536_00525 [Gallionella sp.]